MSMSATELVEETTNCLAKSLPLYRRVAAMLRPGPSASPQLGEAELADLQRAAALAWPELVVMARALESADGGEIETTLVAAEDPRRMLPLVRALADSWLLIAAAATAEDLAKAEIAPEAEILTLCTRPEIRTWLAARSSAS